MKLKPFNEFAKALSDPLFRSRKEPNKNQRIEKQFKKYKSKNLGY